MKFKEKIEAINKELVCLKHTKAITESDKIFPEWAYLKEQYDENQDSSWEIKALITIVNSLLTQRRVYFCVTRHNFRVLAEKDTNWSKAIGLDNNRWAMLFFKADAIGLFKKVKETKVRGKSRVLFELTDPDILSLILVDKEKQKNEALKFIQDIKIADEQDGADRTADRETDPDIDTDVDTVAIAVINSGKNLDAKIAAAKEQLASQSTPSGLPSQNTAAPATTPSCAAPLQKIETEDSKLLAVALAADPSRLTAFEIQFLANKAESLAKYGSFTAKQRETFTSIANKLSRKPKLSTAAAKDILRSFSGSVEPLVASIKGYDYTSSKESLSELITTFKVMQYEDKKALANALDIKLMAPAFV